MARILKTIAAATLGLALIAAAAGCKAETLAPPPPPTLISTVSATGPVTKPPASVTTASPLSGATTSSSAISLVSNKAEVTFPDNIRFTLMGSVPTTITTAVLEYGTDERVLAPEVNRTQAGLTGSVSITAGWTWEMKKTGSIPPGATVWWQWKLTDTSGETIAVPRQTISYEDTRFRWERISLAGVDIYWSTQAEYLRRELTAALEARLARVDLGASIPAERKPKVFVYRSSADLRGAVLNEPDWTGAMAYTSYNIVLTAVDEANLEWAKGALPHEIMHLMVAETVFGPFGDLPFWLNEGLGEYASGSIEPLDRQLIDAAASHGSLISLRSLASSFPADSTQARLAYAQSASVVAYLVDTFGWPKMRQLLQVFKEGSTADNALTRVYSTDMAVLDATWKASLQGS